MFATPHSDMNSLKFGLLCLTSQPFCKKGRSAEVKDGIMNKPGNISLIDTTLLGNTLETNAYTYRLVTSGFNVMKLSTVVIYYFFGIT
jgi:hypothetical protein